MEKYLIVGMGKSGAAARELVLGQAGNSPESVKTFDENPAAVADFHSVTEALGMEPDFLVLSPGYPRTKPLVQAFLKRRGETHLLSELDLGYQALLKLGKPAERFIGITGSAGKSTAVAALARALEAAQKKVFLGGNFGIPFCGYVIDVLKGRRARADFVVLELSSYQLESLKMGFEIGAITSFSRNHLDRYESLEAYYESKASLWDRVSGALILNPESADLAQWFADSFYRDDRRLWWASSRAWTGQKLLGKHNEQNLNVVAEILTHLQMPAISFESLLEFEGLPHRLENCGFRDGVLFVNDSKATTIDSVLVAVEALRGICLGTMHVLIGGRDKDLPWSDLQRLGQYPKVRAWFFGESGEKAQTASGLAGQRLGRLEEFFEKHRPELRPGDVLLLSPGGSSLDQYANFEERGRDFKSLVNRYIMS